MVILLGPVVALVYADTWVNAGRDGPVLRGDDALRQISPFAALMKAYNSRAEASGSGFKENPSPGNIRDGLITDAIKSAGAAKKGRGRRIRRAVRR